MSSRFDTDETKEYKRKQKESLDWRSVADKINEEKSFDYSFKVIHDANTIRYDQGGAPTKLTKQQIEDRVSRQEQIQKAVKAGTYDDPRQPWNRIRRWVEDGGE